MTEAAKQQTAEEYVRSRWEDFDLEDHRDCCPDADPPENWLLLLGSVWRKWAESPEEAWSAAYAFTLEREEQILQVSQQIALLNGVIMMASQADKTVHLRTLRMLNDALAELKRGMRNDRSS